LEAQRDAKRPFNLIFLVEFLQDEAESRTGTVISTKDSTREITLAVGDGTKTENFTGVVIDDYQVKMKDGSLRDLVVSEIPAGTKITVQYFDEMIGPERTTTEVRIYRLRFLAFPQTPWFANLRCSQRDAISDQENRITSNSQCFVRRADGVSWIGGNWARR
jgi:hypothetical protein